LSNCHQKLYQVQKRANVVIVRSSNFEREKAPKLGNVTRAHVKSFETVILGCRRSVTSASSLSQNLAHRIKTGVISLEKLPSESVLSSETRQCYESSDILI